MRIKQEHNVNKMYILAGAIQFAFQSTPKAKSYAVAVCIFPELYFANSDLELTLPGEPGDKQNYLCSKIFLRISFA